MQLPSNMTDLTALSSQLGHKRVAQVMTVILLVYISFVIAKITWSVVPKNQSTAVASSTGNGKNLSSKKTKKLIDVNKIQSLNLFGLYNENAAESVSEAMAASDVPETKLNLVLSGLVASDNKATAAAIIEYKGKQETYGIGDIIVGTRVSLEQVLMDRVLIKQSGKLETLMLDGFDYNQPALEITSKAAANKTKAKGNLGVVDQRNNAEFRRSVKDLRSDFSEDPAKIGDYLRISPKRKDGNIVGYSLRPGKKPEFFKLAGLQSGDVAVQMNGYDLIDTTQAMQAMIEMKKASNISLLVDRQGSLTEILISL
ncbi:type II secretion system protein GspC [Colwellia sp. E2M01]|uniref:type II secretion system protein GspC n=1 Tax=Colwellia sp. E2M01 TaxID=2841561 RepID=UPI001C09DA60|nr:type II secretion system protein GspC [Colwellia sp. E2M01]MBU2870328.1 type II secretion system protein GspC [Colwellia sp. E2M01]